MTAIEHSGTEHKRHDIMGLALYLGLAALVVIVVYFILK